MTSKSEHGGGEDAMNRESQEAAEYEERRVRRRLSARWRAVREAWRDLADGD